MLNLKFLLDSTDAVFRCASVTAGQLLCVPRSQLPAVDALQCVVVQQLPFEFDLRLRVPAGRTIDAQLGVQSNRNHSRQLFGPARFDW